MGTDHPKCCDYRLCRRSHRILVHPRRFRRCPLQHQKTDRDCSLFEFPEQDPVHHLRSYPGSPAFRPAGCPHGPAAHHPSAHGEARRATIISTDRIENAELLFRLPGRPGFLGHHSVLFSRRIWSRDCQESRFCYGGFGQTTPFGLELLHFLLHRPRSPTLGCRPATARRPHPVPCPR